MDENWNQIVADLRSDDLEQAREAFKLLPAQADESKLPELYALLQDPNPFVRSAAAGPLAQLAGMEALPALFDALTCLDPQELEDDLLGQVIQQLIEAHRPEAAPFLLEKLQDPSPQTRANAAWVMDMVVDQVQAEPLIAALQDTDARVRAAAAGALGSFRGSPGVMEALTGVLQDDEDEQVRVSAAASLGELGDERAIPALQAVLWDPAARVRSFAGYALERLGQGVSGSETRLRSVLDRIVKRIKR
jgi:HEAT repeat protein